MKIKAVTDEYIEFTNGNRITYSHLYDCCETNYADFKQIEESAFNQEFIEPLVFEMAEGQGFRFGNYKYITTMYFIPCYSIQNGYYSTDLEIRYSGDCVFRTICEERFG